MPKEKVPSLFHRGVEVVIFTTTSAVSDDNVTKMTTFPFQCEILNFMFITYY